MIQTLNTFNYKGIDIYLMHDTGCHWYEINIGHKTHYFDRLSEAQIFIDWSI